MVLRQTRLAARILCAIILILALGSIVTFGADHPFPIGRGGADMSVPMAEGHFRLLTSAFIIMFAYEQAARVRRWRRNLIRAGGVFATSWLGGLLLIIALQVMGAASAAGFDYDRGSIFCAVIGTLLIIRADQLPKSRPAWFNGIAFPVFASRHDVWRRVHKASALRLLAIGLFAIGMAMFGSGGIDPMAIVIRLLLAELALATLHALFLGATTSRQERQE
jgi:hypothetical protein